MWWQILPTVLIIDAALTVPHLLSSAICWAFTGKRYRRTVEDDQRMFDYLRDLRLTGSPYKLAGLENIPDEEDEC